MAITLGVQKVPSDKANVVSAQVLLNSDEILPSPLAELTKGPTMSSIFAQLSISMEEWDLGSVSLSTVTSPFYSLFTYNFALRFVKKGTAVVDAIFIGPPGPPGVPGGQGPVGQIGQQGLAGVTGPAGPSSPGTTGAIGPAGPPGATGVTGAPGATGPSGGGGGGGFTPGRDLIGTSTYQIVDKIRGVKTPLSPPDPVNTFESYATTPRLWNDADAVSPNFSDRGGAVGILTVLNGGDEEIWVSEGQFGAASPGGPSSYPATTRFIRIIDPVNRKLITSFDLSPFDPFQMCRKLQLSSDGTKVYACLIGNKGSAPHTPPGRVIVIDVATRTAVGNAQCQAGFILGDSYPTGARSACDDEAGNLFVTNSNQQQGNAVEKFSIATILANGASPTLSTATILIPNHAEELVFAAGFIWTGGQAYTNVVTRIDPVAETIDEYGVVIADGSGQFPSGMSYLGGYLWAGDFGEYIYRFDPAQFPNPGVGAGAFLSDSVDLGPTTPSTFAKNGFAFDGTYVWHGNPGSGNPFPATGYQEHQYNLFKFDPTAAPGALTILSRVDIRESKWPTPVGNSMGVEEIAVAGGFIWGTNRARSTVTGIVPIVSAGLTQVRLSDETVITDNWEGEDVALRYVDPTVKQDSIVWRPQGGRREGYVSAWADVAEVIKRTEGYLTVYLDSSSGGCVVSVLPGGPVDCTRVKFVGARIQTVLISFGDTLIFDAGAAIYNPASFENVTLQFTGADQGIVYSVYSGVLRFKNCCLYASTFTVTPIAIQSFYVTVEMENSFEQSAFAPTVPLFQVADGVDDFRLRITESNRLDDPTMLDRLVGGGTGVIMRITTDGSAQVPPQTFWLGTTVLEFILKPGAGVSASRPLTYQNGILYFDNSLKRPIWWDGTINAWVDSTGEPVDNSIRPSFRDVLSTSDAAAHVLTGLDYVLPDNTTTEVTVVVVADGAANGKTFYRHKTYRRSGGAPVSLAYTTAVDNEAATAGAAAWAVTIILSGNTVRVQVQDPGGAAVKWTGEIQFTVGLA